MVWRNRLPSQCLISRDRRKEEERKETECDLNVPISNRLSFNTCCILFLFSVAPFSPLSATTNEVCLRRESTTREYNTEKEKRDFISDKSVQQLHERHKGIRRD